MFTQHKQQPEERKVTMSRTINENINKNICVVGLGYIGLPTAVMFANSGVRVHGVDVNEKAVNMIANKQLHIEENGLQERLEQAIDQELFTVSTKPVEADVYIVAVPSPINPDNTANLEYIRKATASIVPYLKKVHSSFSNRQSHRKQ